MIIIPRIRISTSIVFIKMLSRYLLGTIFPSLYYKWQRILIIKVSSRK